MPGSTKFVRQHFYETVEHKATSRQLSAVPHQVMLSTHTQLGVFYLFFVTEPSQDTCMLPRLENLAYFYRPLSVNA